MLNMTEFKKEFIESCRKELRASGASCYEIEERNVNKAQRGELNGLLFLRPGSICAPTLYVEDFYDMYRRGTSVKKLSRQAVRSVISSRVEADLIEEYSSSKGPCPFEGNLNARLISKRRNRKLLNTVPYRDLGCGLVLIADWVSREYRAIITNELLDQTGLTRDQLFSDALKSMSEREPAVLSRLSDAVMNMHEDTPCHNLLDYPASGTSAGPKSHKPGQNTAESWDTGSSALILTNSSMLWGAASLFYPGVTDKIHALINDDFYIIPSSVHELIIIAAKDADPNALTALLRSANREVVAESDILDDDLYICRDGQVSRVSYGGVIPLTGHPVC